MGFFETYFKDVDFNKEEVAVCCPFPHYDKNGKPYYEIHASAHINTVKRVIHCKVCGKGYSEVEFIKKLLGCSYKEANKLINAKSRDIPESWNSAVINLHNSASVIKKIKKYKITDEVINQLQLGYTGEGFSFPVFIYGDLLDVRTYNPDNIPKVMSRTGAISGLILPFDLWINDNRPTIFCAGEKDMAVCRSHAFNAITITGGENALPVMFKNQIKDRICYIAYDNDDAGIHGAKKLASFLKESGAKSVHILWDLHKTCVNKGEDVTNFFINYNKTTKDFQDLLDNAKKFTEEEYQEIKEIEYPTMRIIDATNGKYINKYVRSNVQVVSSFDQQFIVPEYTIIEKAFIGSTEKYNTLPLGTKKEVSLDMENYEDILYLCDSKLDTKKVNANLRELAHIPLKEEGIKINKKSKVSVFKCTVTDLAESQLIVDDKDFLHTEMIAYSLEEKLESGKNYRLTYKLVPHPLDGQKHVMIIGKIENSNDSVTNFKLTDDVKKQLKVFQPKENETVTEKVNEGIERVKGFLNFDGNNLLITTVDLWYNTPLQFNIGRFKEERAYLDIIVVGASRSGKSETAKKLLHAYELGTFTSLAHGSATIQSLIGGSNKVNGSFQTRAGFIPRNNKGAIIMEELAKAKDDITSALTDIRSSNEIRLKRVAGDLTLPAWVRMLTLSNTKVKRDGTSIPINSYPNGIEILTDLIGANEDIARYDICLVIGEENPETDLFWTPEEPYPTDKLQTRIRWIWSRKPEQIIFEKPSLKLINDYSNKLNKNYGSFIKIFGTEAWKKLSRVAISVAGYTVSTDDSFEKIIVKPEHIEFAYNYFVSIYDNATFRLREYVEEERRYNETNDIINNIAQDLFAKNPTIMMFLENCSETSRNNLYAVSGWEQKEFSVFINQLVANYLIQWKGDRIIPTQRFRKAMTIVNRSVEISNGNDVFSGIKIRKRDDKGA